MLSLRFYYLMKDEAQKYAFVGSVRGLKICCVIASFACLTFPVMTLNGRLAASMMPFGGKTPISIIAPYEWIGVLPSPPPAPPNLRHGPPPPRLPRPANRLSLPPGVSGAEDFLAPHPQSTC